MPSLVERERLKEWPLEVKEQIHGYCSFEADVDLIAVPSLGTSRIKGICVFVPVPSTNARPRRTEAGELRVSSGWSIPAVAAPEMPRFQLQLCIFTQTWVKDDRPSFSPTNLSAQKTTVARVVAEETREVCSAANESCPQRGAVPFLNQTSFRPCPTSGPLPCTGWATPDCVEVRSWL